ncbi:hypothetical protein [Phreatobacter stygius]|uniref:DUF4403 family protein n=1 Tax=Phreatobacter stygius TaxID=1940610 RepID=A0A4D7AZA3_9HYPH|nr:hypothetical protein [Phreatobacter stygius]QCI66679.1 hypothetical protein E8M01_22040 [Phreatobacter stygius]
MFPSVATLRLSAAMLLVLTAAAAAGPADDLKGATVSALSGLQIPGAAIGEARDEGSNLVLSNLTFAAAGERPVGVKITRATISGGPVNGDALTGARVQLEGIEGTAADGQAYRLATAEITGAQGSFAALLASFATREPFFSGASENALTKFSADRISVPSMTVTRRRPARTEEATYNTLAISRYAQGKMAELTIASTVISPAEAGRKVESGAMRFVGFDLTAGVRTGGGAFNALDSGTIEQLRGTGANGAPFSIERIAIGRVTMRAGERSLVALSQAFTEVDPTGSGDDAASRRSLGAMAEVFARLDFERIEITNFRGQGEGRQAFEMQRFAIAGVTQGKIASIEMGGLVAHERRGQITRIGRFLVENIDASGLVALGKDYGEGRFTPGATPPASAYPDVRRILTEDITVTQATGQPLGSVQRAEIEAGPRIGLMPTRIRARITGFDAPITDARQKVQLAPLGIEDKITLAAELEIEYVEAARELRMRTLNVDVNDVGALNLALNIGGIDRAAVEALPASATLLGLAAKAGRLVLSYKESGGVASFLTHTAEQAGVEEEAFTEQLKMQLTAMVGQFVPDKLLASQITTALATFLDDPNSLVITATPKGDVPLAALAMAAQGSPLALLPMFNVTVEANK